MSSIQFDRSFTAKLVCINYTERPQPVVLITRDLATEGTWAGGGWLSLPESEILLDSAELTLRFDFIEKTADRFHYKVSCDTRAGGYRGTYLDTSRNSYLGFYGSVADEVFWKIEVLGVYGGAGDQRPRFRLRDRKGHTVKLYPYLEAMYLNIEGNSKPIEFILQDYQPL